MMSTRCNVSHGWSSPEPFRRCRGAETIVFHHLAYCPHENRIGHGRKQPTSAEVIASSQRSPRMSTSVEHS